MVLQVFLMYMVIMAVVEVVRAASNERNFAWWLGAMIGNAFWFVIIAVVIKLGSMLINWVFS